jgi:hypothetical protein
MLVVVVAITVTVLAISIAASVLQMQVEKDNYAKKIAIQKYIKEKKNVSNYSEPPYLGH